MSHAAQAAHLGSSLSCVDILTAAYWHVLRHRSGTAGRSAARPLHPVQGPCRDGALRRRWRCAASFPIEELDTYSKDGGLLAEHPPAEPAAGRRGRHRLARSRPADRLRHGACRAASRARPSASSRCCPTASTTRARSGRRRCSRPRRSSRTSASSSTTTSGRRPARSNETLALAPLRDKWAAFGWDAREIDGHDVGALARRSCSNVPNGSGKPVAIIAHTVKGKGVSFMEDDNNWHYRTPTAEEVVDGAQGARPRMRNAFADETDQARRRRPARRHAVGRHRQPAVRQVQGRAPGALLQLRRGRSRT